MLRSAGIPKQGISKQSIPEPGITEQIYTADFNKETAVMGRYDKKVIDCFLKNQRQLFPEDVASTPEEAEDFLDMVFATVVSSKKDVRRYFEEDFIDFEGSDPLEAAEVFAVGDGRYLIVDA
jgi:hypothetical protein